MTDFLRENQSTIPAIIFVAFSIPVLICDIRTMKVPDFLVYSGVAVLLLYRLIFARGDILLYIVAAAVSFGLFTLVRRMAAKGLGWADIKYAAFCGLFAGPFATFIGYVLSALYCGIFFVFLKVTGRYERGTAVPFTPFMFLGTVSIAAIPIVKHFTS